VNGFKNDSLVQSIKIVSIYLFLCNFKLLGKIWILNHTLSNLMLRQYSQFQTDIKANHLANG